MVRLTLLLMVVGALAPPPASAVQQPGPPAIGLALSGGGAKGVAHLGVLRTLERLGVPIDIVTGTSAGSVIGAMYATGVSVDSIESVVNSADWPALMGDAVARNRRFLEQRRLDERAILTLPLRATRVTLPVGAIEGSNLMRLLEHVTWRAATIRSFSDLPRRFAAVATDLETGEAVTMTGGVLSEVLRASAGVPGALEPISLDGKLLVDGALSRNLPAVDARELGADILICSDVSDPLETAEELETFVDVLLQLASVSMLESTLEQRKLCDVLIQPDAEEIPSLSFDVRRFEELMALGEEAAVVHADALVPLSMRPGAGAGRREPPPFLGDSIGVSSIEVEGTDDPSVVDLVRTELGLVPGDYVNRELIEARLSDLDATELFGLVRYRIDRTVGGATLTLVVDEQPQDRLGVGLRYDDERRAALLFTGSLHNLIRYGSVTRVDLRVGEETQIGLRFRRRQGVTGSFGYGLALAWSQATLGLPATLGGRTGLELTTGRLYLGLGVGRATSVGTEVTAERVVSDTPGASVELASVSAVLDHETLDRIDFPTSGADVVARAEWGGTDVGIDEGFSVATFDGRLYVPVHGRLTMDLGAFVGYGTGADLPLHRRFVLGGTHRSTVFRRTHVPFLGLGDQERSGRSVQVARAGLRWEVRPNAFLRAGVDVGDVGNAWRFPIRSPEVGGSLSAGFGSVVGPVVFQLSQLWADRGPRLSIRVGREI